MAAVSVTGGAGGVLAGGEAGVQSQFFEEIDAENRRGTLLVQGLNEEVHGIAAHPTVSTTTMAGHHNH